MSENNLTKKAMKNIQGNIQLEKSRLEYVKEIATILGQNPELLPELINTLELSKEEFYANLSGNYKGNITFYDQTLYLIKKKTKENTK